MKLIIPYAYYATYPDLPWGRRASTGPITVVMIVKRLPILSSVTASMDPRSDNRGYVEKRTIDEEFGIKGLPSTPSTSSPNGLIWPCLRTTSSKIRSRLRKYTEPMSLCDDRVNQCQTTRYWGCSSADTPHAPPLGVRSR